MIGRQGLYGRDGALKPWSAMRELRARSALLVLAILTQATKWARGLVNLAEAALGGFEGARRDEAVYKKQALDGIFNWPASSWGLHQTKFDFGAFFPLSIRIRFFELSERKSGRKRFCDDELWLHEAKNFFIVEILPF